MMQTSSAATGPVGQSFPPDFFDMTVLFHLWRFGHLCKKVQAAASLNGSVQGYCPVLSWCPLDSARNRYSDFGSGKADGFGHNLELSLSQVQKNFLDIQIPVLLMEFCLLSLIKLSSLRIKDKYIALAISCSPLFHGLVRSSIKNVAFTFAQYLFHICLTCAASLFHGLVQSPIKNVGYRLD